MHLNRIELTGFKSFADKTVFDLRDGITAILGPNGCGKSNVVDAVKWVLGETSAKALRGTEMMDVIFAGSERRKPLGMAEVNLFFDNSDGTLGIDYNEVVVTRRLYRSGESEYCINRHVCRKRDIRDLFLDTGIGTSAYSFIEQGKVESLLQAKPQERRQVFEEAAGISKYKQHRKETLSRLDRTQQYLDRVNDIVEEVEKAHRRVSRQAASAKRYQRLKNELDLIKRVSYCRDWLGLRDRLDGVDAQLAELESLLTTESAAEAEVTSRIAALTEQEMDQAKAAEVHDGERQRVQEALGTVQLDLSATEARLQGLDQRRDEAASRLEGLHARLGGFDEAESEARRRLALARIETRALAALLAERDADRQARQTALATAEQGIDAARREMLALTDDRTALASARAGSESEAESLRQRIEETGARQGGFEERRAALDGEIERLSADRDAMGEKVSAALAAKDELKESERATRQRIEDLTERRSSLQSAKAGLESRLQTLEDLEKNLAGAYAGVKAVIQASREGVAECREVRGMAVDLMTVPSDVALAIETTLGGSAQDVIVDTAYGAQQCIQYLKRTRSGRATFLPLDRIRPRRRLERGALNQPGVVGEAVDLVEFDGAHRAAMEYLLGGVLIVETLDAARQVAGGAARGVKIVTLDGEVINPSGAMTGGQGERQKGGLVTRKAEKDEIAGRVREVYEKLHGAEDGRKRALDELSALAEKIQEAERALAALIAEGQAVEQALSIKRNEADLLARDREGLEGELSRLQERLTALDERRADFEARAAAIAEKESACSASLEAALAAQREAREALDGMVDSTAGLREKRAETAGRAEEAARRLEDLARDREDRTRELAEAESLIARAGDERAGLEERIATLKGQEANLLDQRDTVGETGVGLREQLNALRDRLREAREEERAAQRRIGEIQRAQSDLKLGGNEARLKLEAVEAKALEELEIEDLPTVAKALAAEMARMAEAEAEAEAGAEAGAAEDGAGAERAEDGASDGSDADGDDAGPAAQQDLSEAFAWRIDTDELKRRVRETGEKIGRIGPVNLCAIEELAELEARREFLKSEQDDIQQAADDLFAVIERLNQECLRRFEATFVAVRENFQELFHKLFGGGKADLVLEKTEDGQDALDGGIDIVARPPGKEPKSISLLSGGEKALCAVALLFAIFRSKPSPFCILDEVDGPLDESNIDRFMSAVREFSAETQFLLISHSKRTMQMTDDIYGVTQDEPGVSTRYSLSFKGRDEEAAAAPAEAEVAAVG